MRGINHDDGLIFILIPRGVMLAAIFMRGVEIGKILLL